MQLDSSHVDDSCTQPVVSWQANAAVQRKDSLVVRCLQTIGLRKPERCVIALGVDRRRRRRGVCIHGVFMRVSVCGRVLQLGLAGAAVWRGPGSVGLRPGGMYVCAMYVYTMIISMCACIHPRFAPTADPPGGAAAAALGRGHEAMTTTTVVVRAGVVEQS